MQSIIRMNTHTVIGAAVLKTVLAMVVSQKKTLK